MIHLRHIPTPKNTRCSSDIRMYKIIRIRLEEFLGEGSSSNVYRIKWSLWRKFDNVLRHMINLLFCAILTIAFLAREFYLVSHCATFYCNSYPTSLQELQESLATQVWNAEWNDGYTLDEEKNLGIISRKKKNRYTRQQHDL